MTRVTELTPLLKRLPLGPVATTLPERIALARREQLDYASVLEIILADEISRRENRRIEIRLHNAGFEETCRLEDFDWTASVTVGRRLLHAVFSLEFLAKHEHVLLVGPAGVGKSFLAQALGYAAVRAGYTVRFIHADDFSKAMAQARVDNSVDRTFRSFLSRPAHPGRHSGCIGSPHSSPPTSTTSSSIGIKPAASSSPPTAPSRSGSACSTIPSSATARSTGWPTPAIRSSPKAKATGRGSSPTGHSHGQGSRLTRHPQPDIRPNSRSQGGS